MSLSSLGCVTTRTVSLDLTCGRELQFFKNILLFSPQLIAWEPTQEEEVTMVTARPNFQDSIHVGFVSGLKKFTEYFTSVLCFTTPGDGPRSSPQLVRTHEDGRCHGPQLYPQLHSHPPTQALGKSLGILEHSGHPT